MAYNSKHPSTSWFTTPATPTKPRVHQSPLTESIYNRQWRQNTLESSSINNYDTRGTYNKQSKKAPGRHLHYQVSQNAIGELRTNTSVNYFRQWLHLE